MQAPGNGAVVALIAPVSATLPSGATVAVSTDYPFEDRAVVTVTTAVAMPLLLRIPKWSGKATVNNVPVQAGTLFNTTVPPGTSMYTLQLAPEIRMEPWGCD